MNYLNMIQHIVLINNIKLLPACYILCAIIVVSLATLIIALIRTKKIKNTIVAISSCMMIIAVILMFIGYNKFRTGQSHGLQTTDISIKQLWYGVNHSPKENELPDNLTGCIVIYYKFGCNDCEAIYDDLKNNIQDKPNIYWVCSDSVQGEQLLEQYPVTEVPTGIYIRQESFNESITYTKKYLATVDEDGNTILNQKDLDRLLYLQSENR